MTSSVDYKISPKSESLPWLAKSLWPRLGIALLFAILVALPVLISDYRLFQVTLALAYAIALLGLNVLTGYNGQISIGHGAFFALGAYAVAISTEQFGIPYWAAVPLAGLICFGFGFLFGLPALRLEGVYLALATFALAVALPQLLKFKGFEPWTNGVGGILVQKPVAPAGIPISSDHWIYYFSLVWTIASFVIAYNLLQGHIGRAIIAIRQNPIAASTMGVNLALYKSLTFAVSAGFGGIAGALAALSIQFVSPDSFGIYLSISFLVGIVVGGLGTLSGALFGAIFVQFIPNVADQISKAAPWAIYGVILIAAMHLMPTGVVGAFRRLRSWVDNRRRA